MSDEKTSTKQYQKKLIDLQNQLENCIKLYDKHCKFCDELEYEMDAIKRELITLEKGLHQLEYQKEELLDEIAEIEAILDAQEYPIYSPEELEELGQWVLFE